MSGEATGPSWPDDMRQAGDAAMDARTMRLLNEVNAAFYTRAAPSFSATRHAPWPGWTRCLADARAAAVIPAGRAGDAAAAEASRRLAGQPLRVRDVACGNLRFARFLAEQLPNATIDYHGVDACDALPDRTGIPARVRVRLTRHDVVSALLAEDMRGVGDAGSDGDGRADADLVACFGFLHHVPGAVTRARLMRELVAGTRPGGVCLVSFWEFGRDEALAARARNTTRAACAALGIARSDLEPGDRLLDWQRAPGLWRYCHDFTTPEVSALVAALGDTAAVLDRFRADGRGGGLNEYVVLRRRGVPCGGAPVR